MSGCGENIYAFDIARKDMSHSVRLTATVTPKPSSTNKIGDIGFIMSCDNVL
jgi:hypothetical protein